MGNFSLFHGLDMIDKVLLLEKLCHDVTPNSLNIMTKSSTKSNWAIIIN